MHFSVQSYRTNKPIMIFISERVFDTVTSMIDAGGGDSAVDAVTYGQERQTPNI